MAGTGRPAECPWSPYEKAWEAAHESVRHALKGIAVGRDPADARVLTTLLKEQDTTEDDILREAELLCSAAQAYNHPLRPQLQRIIREAARVTHFTSEDISPVPEVNHVQGTASMDSLPRSLLSGWRLKRPSDTNPTGDGVTQRDRERDLAAKWRSRILNTLRPHAAGFAHLEAALLDPNPEEACHDLFGITRPSTLAGLCRNLDAMLKRQPDLLPWTDKKVMQLFGSMRNGDGGPHKPLRYHFTLKKLGAMLGSETRLDSEMVLRKRDAVRDTLCRDTLTSDKRALAPTRAAAAALEEASEKAPTEPLKWLASALRFALGASARLNDCQHAAPKELVKTEGTAELRAWQTKVTGLLTNRRPMPLIAPLHSLSGKLWWLKFYEGIAGMEEDTFLANRDFLIPEVTTNLRSYKRQPMQNPQLLRHFRRLLVVGGCPAEEAGKLTLPSLRVFMAEQAYQSGIPRDLRRYIGRWAHESLADTYTRDHRTVITKIWETVLTTPEKNTGRLVPADLEHGYWRLQQLPEDAEGARKAGSPPPSPEAHSRSASPTVCMDEAGQPGASQAQETDIQDDPRAYEEIDEKPSGNLPKTPADKVSINDGGPLTVAISLRKKGTPPKHTVHFMCTVGPRAGRTAGCNRKLTSARHRPIEDVVAWREVAHACEQCTFCEARYRIPTGWEDLAGGEQNPESGSNLTTTSSDGEAASEAASPASPEKRARRRSPS